MSNITDLLNKRAEDVEKPKPLPTGFYLCIIDGLPKIEEVQTKKGPMHVAELSLKPVQAGEDVDHAMLSEQGGIGERKLRHTLWIAEDSLWRIKDLAVKLGIEVDGKNLGQVIQEFSARQCMAKVIHKPSADGSELFANIETITGV